MSETIRRLTGRALETRGISEAAWGWIALWAVVAAVAGLAAATVEPIARLGQGAVVLTALAAASAVALAFAGCMGLAAIGAGRRSARPADAEAGPGGDPILREFAVSFAAQLARLEDKLNAASRNRPGAAADPAQEAIARAVDRLAQEQRAFFDSMKAEAEAAERRSKAQVDALAGSVLPRVAGLDEAIGRLRRALSDADARSRDFEAQVFDILRARDADKVLRRLDAEASDLFDKLFYAEGRGPDAAEAWRADYAAWRSRIKSFWDIVRGYKTSVDQPFSVAEADIDHAGGVPDGPLFTTPDMQLRYKMLILVNERHIKFRDDAFLFNAKKGTPPEAAAPLPQRNKLSQPAAS